jgi:YceI-like domain
MPGIGYSLCKKLHFHVDKSTHPIMKNVFVFTACLLFMNLLRAQDKYFTKSGKIEFMAVDDKDVYAVSRSAVVVLDKKTGALDFSILVKSFELKKALMQEKFDHKILETDDYPKAGFKGQISNKASVKYDEPGEYPVQASGKLTLHGITRDVLANGTIIISKESIRSKSVFSIQLPDYNISNPGVGNTIEITVDCKLEPLKN